MKTVSYFGGKLEIDSLALVKNPAERSDVRARLLVPTGELTTLADGKTPIMHLAYVELKAGVPRGNHFHKLRYEHFYLFAGELELIARDRSTAQTVRVTMRVGDLARVKPEVVHTFRPLVDGHGIEFAAEVFDGADVYHEVLTA